jgi:hypothetical protein
LKEVSILQATAYLKIDPDYVTFATASGYFDDSGGLIKSNNIRSQFIQWLKTPYKPPEIIPEPEEPAEDEEEMLMQYLQEDMQIDVVEDSDTPVLEN